MILPVEPNRSYCCDTDFYLHPFDFDFDSNSNAVVARHQQRDCDNCHCDDPRNYDMSVAVRDVASYRNPALLVAERMTTTVSTQSDDRHDDDDEKASP